MSLFRTIAVYLGLGPDDEYDDDYAYDERGDDGRPASDRSSHDRDATRVREPEPRPAVVAKGSPRRAAAGPADETSAVSAVRSLRPVPEGSGAATTNSRPQEAQPRQQQREPAVSQDPPPPVRPAAQGRAKPSALSPQTFADAKVVADEFKQQIPVILNLQGLDRDLVRRLVDFSSGLCYGLDGTMEKIASQVFLLTPNSVKVTAEDRRRIEERGFER